MGNYSAVSLYVNHLLGDITDTKTSLDFIKDMAMASSKTLLFVSTAFVLTAVSVVSMAQTASKSPFANKKPKAWEQPSAPAPTQAQPPQYKAPSYQQPSYQPPPAPTAKPHGYTYQAPSQYQPAPLPAQPSQPSVKTSSAPAPQQPSYQYQAPSSPYQAPTAGNTAPSNMAGGSYYPGKAPAQPNYQPQPTYNQPAYASPYGQQQAAQAQPQRAAPALRGASSPYGESRSWLSRIGLGNVETSLEGHAKGGVAYVDNNGSDVESVVDIDVRAEASAITQGGLEYGAGLRVRAQRDRHRHGFGGRVGDCPAADPACTGVLVGADTRAVKGHTGQFYTDGRTDTKETEFALEGAYIFLRSSYGDIVFGRDDGSAALFSLGAPSLVAINASNSPVDYTGLDSVKTVNDASGFATKVAYTTPRLLGDQIGVGVQMGVSYAPTSRACGVDYCVRENGIGADDPFAPEIKNVIEVGVALDRKFDNGLSVELTGTYARGSDDSGLAVFDDLQTYGAGLEIKAGDWVFGSSFLNSNNGFAGQGDYNAYDAGLTWKPGKLGFTASYGHADDDIAHITSDQGVFAVSYDIGKFRLGSGVQYIDRTVPFITPTGRDKRSEDALALFIEGGVTF